MLTVTKPNASLTWPELNATLDSLISSEEPAITALSNAAALLFTSLENINWAGFYLFDDEKLILGPFGGKPACTVIPMGLGVCGTSASTRKTVVVKDVDQFPGHIACDAASRSEIVTPIVLSSGKLFGVIDIDAPMIARFDDNDGDGLEKFATILSQKLGLGRGRPSYTGTLY